MNILLAHYLNANNMSIHSIPARQKMFYMKSCLTRKEEALWSYEISNLTN